MVGVPALFDQIVIDSLALARTLFLPILFALWWVVFPLVQVLPIQGTGESLLSISFKCFILENVDFSLLLGQTDDAVPACGRFAVVLCDQHSQQIFGPIL